MAVEVKEEGTTESQEALGEMIATAIDDRIETEIQEIRGIGNALAKTTANAVGERHEAGVLRGMSMLGDHVHHRMQEHSRVMILTDLRTGLLRRLLPLGLVQAQNMIVMGSTTKNPWKPTVSQLHLLLQPQASIHPPTRQS
jgi:hypothetical protein